MDRAQRLRENEELMERLNARMLDTVEEIRDEAGEDPDEPFAFFCECSSLACRERVQVRPTGWLDVHRDPDRFVLVPGHEIPDIEVVVDQEQGYLIVRKIA